MSSQKKKKELPEKSLRKFLGKILEDSQKDDYHKKFLEDFQKQLQKDS